MRRRSVKARSPAQGAGMKSQKFRTSVPVESGRWRPIWWFRVDGLTVGSEASFVVGSVLRLGGACLDPLASMIDSIREHFGCRSLVLAHAFRLLIFH